MDVIKKFEETPCTLKKALAEHFNVRKSTLRGVLKNREAVTVAYRECGIQSSASHRWIENFKNKLGNSCPFCFKVPPTHTLALEALETLCDYFQFNSGSENTFLRLDELEKSLLENSRKQKQSSILYYFLSK